MMMYGFRRCKVQTGTSGTFGKMPAHFVEVTAGSTDITFTPNANSNAEGGAATPAIPVKANTTRQIPMYVVDWAASGTVTVIGYLP